LVRDKKADKAHAHSKRLGNRLANPITMSCHSLSAVVPAEEYNSAFNRYIQL